MIAIAGPRGRDRARRAAPASAHRVGQRPGDAHDPAQRAPEHDPRLEVGLGDHRQMQDGAREVERDEGEEDVVLQQGARLAADLVVDPPVSHEPVASGPAQRHAHGHRRRPYPIQPGEGDRDDDGQERDRAVAEVVGDIEAQRAVDGAERHVDAQREEDGSAHRLRSSRSVRSSLSADR